MGLIHRVVIASIFIALGAYVIMFPSKAQTYMQNKYKESIEHTKGILPKDMLKDGEKHDIFNFETSKTHYILGGLSVLTGLCILFSVTTMVFVLSVLFLLVGTWFFYPHQGWRKLPIEELRVLLFVLALYFNMLLVVGETKSKGKKLVSGKQEGKSKKRRVQAGKRS